MKKNKDLKQLSLSKEFLQEEIKKETYKNKYTKVLKSTIYVLIIIAAISALVVTLIMPVLEVNNTTMNPLLDNNDIIISLKTKSLNKGDVIAFYQGNKILIKRVVATPGNYISIDEEGSVYVDGTLLDEPYVTNKQKGETNIEFPYQVPENTYFVLSDERDKTTDSRNEDIGLIKKDNIIGKVIFRVWPLKKLGAI